jgi:hypothetical protein
MNDTTYHAIVGGLHARGQIRRMAASLIDRMRLRYKTKAREHGRGSSSDTNGTVRAIFAIHVRRGDYWNKCRKIKDKALQRKCFPSNDDIGRVLSGIWAEHREKFATNEEKPLIYVATNEPGVRRELDDLYATVFDLVYLEDVLVLSSTSLDPIEMALLDIEICSLVEYFIGGFYSSFARSIFEKRELAGRAFSTY